jgi:hypothetical protein
LQSRGVAIVSTTAAEMASMAARNRADFLLGLNIVGSQAVVTGRELIDAVAQAALERSTFARLR